MATEHITGGDSLRVKQVACSSCNALCCRGGMSMGLSPAEAAFMGLGTGLAMVAPPKRRLLPVLPRGNATYELGKDCARLVDNPTGGAPLCGAHEDPGRPTACGNFEPGVLACRTLRFRAGIDTAAEYFTFVAVTGQDPGLLQAVIEAAQPQPADVPPAAAA